MWAVRTFGWTIMGIGIAVLIMIPYLMASGRGDEVWGAVGAGIVGIALGLLIVKVITKPDQ